MALATLLTQDRSLEHSVSNRGSPVGLTPRILECALVIAELPIGLINARYDVSVEFSARSWAATEASRNLQNRQAWTKAA